MSSADDNRSEPRDDDVTADGEHGAPSPPSEGESAELLRQIQEGAMPDRRMQPDRRSVERRRRHLWRLLFFFATVVAILIVLSQFLVDLPGTPLDIPPDELIGTWTTDAPRYAGRFIRIGQDRLTLGLGEGGQETYPVQSIRVETADIHRQYLIRYEGPEGTDEILEAFIYDDGLMRLKNPSEVRWTRRPD